MTLRSVLACLLVALMLLTVTLPVRAGTYLDSAALLLDQSRRERDLVRPRVTDKDLVELAHEMALARTRYARRMPVPKSVASAHPHLLLVLENSERAYAAALDGDLERFVVHIERARTEDRTFRVLIAKLGYTLPSLPR